MSENAAVRGRGGGSAVLVKLGGSLITHKSGDASPRDAVVRRLAAELAEGAREIEDRVVLGHGSGSFGHPPAAEHGLREGASSAAELAALSRTQDRAARLHRRVVAELRTAGLDVFSVVPSSAAVAEDGQLVDFAAEPLLRALELGLTPAVYGDVIVDRRRGATIASTEAVLSRLTASLAEGGWRVRRALWLGATEGVYDSEGRVLAEIDPGSDDALPEAVTGSEATDVTGGMRHRVSAAMDLASRGVPSWIGDGRPSGALREALRGTREGGTWVRPADAAGPGPAGADRP